MVPTPGIGISVPNAPPNVAPIALAAALPSDSPNARDTTKSISPPTIGIRLKIGRKNPTIALPEIPDITLAATDAPPLTNPLCANFYHLISVLFV